MIVCITAQFVQVNFYLLNSLIYLGGHWKRIIIKVMALFIYFICTYICSSTVITGRSPWLLFPRCDTGSTHYDQRHQDDHANPSKEEELLSVDKCLKVPKSSFSRSLHNGYFLIVKIVMRIFCIIKLTFIKITTKWYSSNLWNWKNMTHRSMECHNAAIVHMDRSCNL